LLRRPLPALLIVPLLVAAGFLASRAVDGDDETTPGPGTGGVLGATESSRSGRVLVVTPDGDDGGAGTPASPLRTIGRALSVARGGARIQVAPGSYPAIRDTRAHARTVRVVGVGATRPRIAGAELAGARRIRFSRVRFTEPVLIRGDPVRGYRRPSMRIAFHRSAFRTSESADAGDACLTIRDRSSFISVRRSKLGHCFSGIVGPGNSPSPHSSHIRIVRNLIQNVPGDGIQFGEWDDVKIARNVIRHMRDPEGEIHNDGVQFVGDSRRVRITRNRIYDSGGQLVFIQDAFGPIDDVLVSGNLLYGSDAIAIQNQGATDTRYLYNTIWDTRYGALLLRQGEGGATPRDTVVVGNILESFEASEGARARYRDYNLIQQHQGTPAPHERVGLSPRFRNARGGDYRLSRRSPAVRRGERRWAPRRDLDGRVRRRPPSLGALEYARRRRR
jgi:Right handed beta helix region/Protein of unknown function (DUF1565)